MKDIFDLELEGADESVISGLFVAVVDDSTSQGNGEVGIEVKASEDVDKNDDDDVCTCVLEEILVSISVSRFTLEMGGGRTRGIFISLVKSG